MKVFGIFTGAFQISGISISHTDIKQIALCINYETDKDIGTESVCGLCLGSPLWELSSPETPKNPSSHPFFSQERACQIKMTTW